MTQVPADLIEQKGSSEDIRCASGGSYSDESSLYIVVTIGGQEVTCLVDCGSTLSVVHPSIVRDMDEEPGLVTKEVTQLKMADGGITYSLGQVEVNLDFNGLLCSQVMTVAEVTSLIVLGMDFLVKHGAVLDVARRCLELDGQTFTCKTEEELDQVFRVASTRAVEIPPRSEMIIEGETLHPPHFAAGLLEITEEMVDRKGLFAARKIIETCDKKMPVRVMNPSKQPQMPNQGQIAAICQAVKSTSAQETVEGEEAQPQVLPPHFQAISDKCEENLSRREYSKVAEILLKYQDVCVKTKEDLGHTGLEQHRIDTGDGRTGCSQEGASQREVTSQLRRQQAQAKPSPARLEWEHLCYPIEILSEDDWAQSSSSSPAEKKTMAIGELKER